MDSLTSPEASMYTSWAVVRVCTHSALEHAATCEWAILADTDRGELQQRIRRDGVNVPADSVSHSCQASANAAQVPFRLDVHHLHTYRLFPRLRARPTQPAETSAH